MPRRPWSRDSAPETPRAHRAVVGSARRINLGRRQEIERLRVALASTWQPRAWQHYDQVGEIKYGFNYVANTLSRIRLFAAYQPDDRDGPPVPIGEAGGIDRDLVTAARYEMAKLDTAHGGQPGLIRSYGLNMLVAGECYLAEVADRLGVYSTRELQVYGANSNDSSGVRLIGRRERSVMDYTDLPTNTYLARIWRPHPAFSDDADSSMLGVADSADELIMLTKMIRASAMSQINAGLLYVPEELSFQRAAYVTADADPDDPESPEEDDEDVFEEELISSITEPITDDGSPGSVVPLLIRGPADMGEHIKRIDLSRQFDEHAVNLREAALNRVLNGIDLPKDLVTGLSNVRFSNGQQIAENLYKAHVEPAAVDLCEALSTVRLRPALLARGFSPDQLSRVTTWYDASEVTVSANRAQDADAGHDRILISDATWRRDHGFAEADKPDDEEHARRIAEKTPVAPETAIQLLAAVSPLIAHLAQSGNLVLQPSNMNPQRPPRIPAVQQATIPGAIEPIPASRIPGRGGALPAGSTPATPPPEGTPAPVTPGPAVTAAARRGRRTPERDAQRLLDIERRLRATLQTMLSDMTERALEKAGSRLASKVRGEPKLQDRIRDVPKAQVAAALGPEIVAAAGYTQQQLVDDSVNDAESKYLAAVAEAQQQAAQIVGSSVFSPDDVSHSWSVLKPLLVAFMLRALFRKEHDGYTPKVPMDDVRAALARAGGGQPKAPAVHGPQPGAVLSDRAIAALSDAHDSEHESYRWVYGISENHFQPHLDLDGVTFNDWKDEVLANPGAWPKVDHLYPGDHSGCECDWLPQYVPRLPHEGRVVEHR